MRFLEGRKGRAALIACLIALSACSPPAEITVGSKNFTEQDILGELIAYWIERTTDIDVRRQLHLGGTYICHRALLAGEIDLYVEYTGTALTAILERPVEADPAVALATVREAYADSLGIEWTASLGFENTFAILVRRATADSLGLRTIGDVAEHAAGLTPGFGYEFVNREDGFAGLRRWYGLAFAGPPLTMDLGLIYRALAEGRIDITAGNSTDGQIASLDLVQLVDDKNYFPPYEAAPVVRRETLERLPALRTALDRLGGLIDLETMRTLNHAVDVEGRPFVGVAHAWVDDRLGPVGN